MIDSEEYLTNERFGELTSNQFHLVNALIQKARYQLKSGKEPSYSHHENPVLDILNDAMNDTTLFDEDESSE